MTRLASKAALITGGGGGIGAACARIFCAEGAAVTLVDMDAEALARTAEAIGAAVPHARVATFVADVSDSDQAEQAVQLATRAHGRLDILVNNAAMRNYASVVDAKPADWQTMIGVNLIGTANYCGWRQLPWPACCLTKECYPSPCCRSRSFLPLQWSKAVGMWAKAAAVGNAAAQRRVVHGRSRCAARRIVHMSIACRARSARPPRRQRSFARCRFRLRPALQWTCADRPGPFP